MPYRTHYRAWAALFVSLAPALALADDIPLFIFAGQSNMVGYGTDASQLTLEQQAVQPNVLYPGQPQFPVVVGNINWAPMQPPTENSAQTLSGHGFGPEGSAPLTISNGMAGQKVGAIKWAVNDTGLRIDSGLDDWHPESHEIFDSMLLQVSTAKAQLPIQQAGTTGTVSGFFWMQGERDATDQDRADIYQYNLTQLIAAVRAEYSNPNLPIVIGQINGGGTYVDTVRRAQANVAKYDSNVALVDTSTLEHGAGSLSLHLTSKGTYDLGEAMGKAYLGLTGPALPARPAPMNRVVDGGFEDYAVTNYAGFPTAAPVGSGTFYPSNPIPGWSMAQAGGHTLVNAAGFGPAAEGQQWLSLENKAFGPGNGGAQQTVDVTNGQQYTVLFSYAAISFGDSFNYQFSFDSAGAGTHAFNVNTSGFSQNSMTPWQTASITFAAVGSSETLRFLPTATNNQGFYGPGIDNVRLLQGSVWDDNAAGNDWNDNTKWLGSATPDSAGAIANFIETSTGKTVNVTTGSGSATVGSLRFDSSASYTLSSTDGSKIVLNNSPAAQNASILVVRGSHAINVQLDMQDSVDADLEAGSSLTVNGALHQVGGTRSLRKFGGGELTLTNASSDYTGMNEVVDGTLTLTNGASTNLVPVSAGFKLYAGATLDVRNLSGGGITLGNNQTLQGNGRVRGGVNATNANTSINAGNSVGQLTFTDAGAITLDSSTSLTFEVGGNGSGSGTPGVSYDQIVIDGTGVGGGGKVLTLDNATLHLVALPGLAYNTPYRLISTVGNASINFTPGFLALSEGPTYEEGGLHYTVDYDGSYFAVSFVPEPSSIVLAMAGMILTLRRRRK